MRAKKEYIDQLNSLKDKTQHAEGAQDHSCKPANISVVVEVGGTGIEDWRCWGRDGIVAAVYTWSWYRGYRNIASRV
jgi:hypothetical protein